MADIILSQFPVLAQGWREIAIYVVLFAVVSWALWTAIRDPDVFLAVDECCELGDVGNETEAELMAADTQKVTVPR